MSNGLAYDITDLPNRDTCTFCKAFQRRNSMRIVSRNEISEDAFAFPKDEERKHFKICETCFYCHCVITGRTYLPLQTLALHEGAPRYLQTLDLVENTQ